MSRKHIPVTGTVLRVRLTDDFEIETLDPEEQTRREQEAREEDIRAETRAEVEAEADRHLQRELADQRATLLEQCADEKRQAFAQGEEKGRAEGITRGRAEIESTQQSLLAALAALEDDKRRMFQEGEGLIVGMAMAMARKVVHGELETQPDLIRPVVQEALTFLADEMNVRVHLNPEDVEAVGEVLDTFRRERGDRFTLEVVKDPAVGRGGCFIDTDAGQIDARLETKLRDLERLMQPGH